ncbi:MAG: RsmB/NOP family class I SAM-dependent RNA methyltransferase [Neisseriaceae bacterium]
MLDHLVLQLKFLIKELLKFNFSTEKILNDYFRTHKNLNSQERHIISETIYSILRNYYKLTASLDGYSILEQLQPNNKELEKYILNLIMMVWIHFLKLTPEQYKSVKNVDFDKLISLTVTQSDESIHELPMWILSLLEKHYSSNELLELSKALQSKAPLDLRINILKVDLKSVLNNLHLDNIEGSATKYSPYGIRILNKVSFYKNKLFTNGKIEIQDESSQLAGMLLSPKRGDIVVDFCAGSGGKTLLLGMLMRNTGRIYAFDINERRLGNLTPRLQKSGLSNVYPQLISNEDDLKIKRLFGKVDKVFADVPCSGLGTLRRSPELKLRYDLESIVQLNIKQLSILNSASKLLKIGGYIVYATCSILYEENQNIVNKFLDDNPGFTKINAGDALGIAELKRNDGFLVLLPHINQTDGFFAALLRRNY